MMLDAVACGYVLSFLFAASFAFRWVVEAGPKLRPKLQPTYGEVFTSHLLVDGVSSATALVSSALDNNPAVGS